MKPLTILLLVTAIAACFVTALATDARVVLLARLVYGIAFVASILAFARGLPRTQAEPEEPVSRPRPVAGNASSMTVRG